MTVEQYLDACEKIHRDVVGAGNFCYVPTMITMDLYRLSICRRGEGGHYPLSEDYTMTGTLEVVARWGDELNLKRLKLDAYDNARIIASSMRVDTDGRSFKNRLEINK